MARAQGSTEMVLIMVAGLSVLCILFAIVISMRTTVSTIYQNGLARVVADDVSQAATTVWRQGDGARQLVYVTLPDDTTAVTMNGTIFVLTRGTAPSQRLVIRSFGFNVTGNVSAQRSQARVVLERTGSRVNMRVTQ